MREIWKDVKGYEGLYQVSNLGNVRGLVAFPFVNHLDGNKLNNCVSNLEWCSASRNIKHAYDTGLKRTRHVLQLSKDGKAIQIWDNMSRASESLGIGVSHIFQCCTGQRKTAGGFKWAYTE